MNIEEIAKEYNLGKDDFWELRKNSGKWIITNNACEKIAIAEGIIFEPPQIINYTPTIITENGEKVQKVNYGRQSWKPAWAGTCQKKTGDVAMIVTGYKKDNPDYKIWSTGEANGENCTMGYRLNIAEKRGKNRVTLKLINAYQHDIYSDVEADDFVKKPTKPTKKQIEFLEKLENDLGLKHCNTEVMTKEEITAMIDDYNNEIHNRESEEHARKQEELIKE